MARALIVGGGGIGRGFVPWILNGFAIDIYDTDTQLTQGIAEQGFFTSWMSDGAELRKLVVRPERVTSDFADIDPTGYDIAFISVGPRNIAKLPSQVGLLTCPVFSLENDPITVEWLKSLYGMKDAVFGVPDVIASSTASPESLAADRFSLHTENGVMFLQESKRVDDRLKALLPDVEWLPVDQLNAEWDAKLYIHNTPHCVAAYLGYLSGCTYLHEALARPAVARIVDGVVDEILTGLKLVTHHDHDFLESYARKEMRRFSNANLYDPISRVAREPIRKLHPSGRLMGALRLLLTSGVEPVHLMAGIAASLRYLEPRDRDCEALRLLPEFGVKAWLKFHLSIPPGSIESDYVAQNFDAASAYLDRVLA